MKRKFKTMDGNEAVGQPLLQLALRIVEGHQTGVAYYKLKPDAPTDTLENLSKSVIGPLLEKLLNDGTLHEYEIDAEAIHTEAPGAFWVDSIAAGPEGIDKVQAAIREAVKSNPTIGPAFASATDGSAHRDFLSRTNATYK